MPTIVIWTFFILTFVILGTAAYTSRVGAPWVPSKKMVRQKALDLSKLGDAEILYDLGSGTGSLLFETIERHPSSRAVGVELSVLPYLFSVLKKISGGRRYKNVHLHYKNLFRCNVSKADAVFVFLMPGCYGRLAKKFSRELKDDCRVIIEAWPFPGMEPLQQIKDNRHLSLYLYKGRQFREKK